MADIKTKKKEEISIKKLDRATIMGQNLKSNIISVKDKTKENYEKNENTAQEYAENKVNSTMHDIIYYTPRLNRKGKQNFEKTIQNIEKGKVQIKKAQKGIKNVKRKGKITINKAKRNIKKVQNTVKSAKNTVKTTEKTAKATIKTTKQVAKNSVKLAQRTAQMTKQAVKTTIQATKVAIKTTIAIIKAIIAATKALVSAIIAGGWVAVVVIVVICLIAMICSSVFGIFFANEKKDGEMTVNSVMAELNTEFSKEIEKKKRQHPNADYDIKYARANWRDVIAVYTVMISNGDYKVDVMTMDDNRAKTLKKVFWDMNEFNEVVDKRQEKIKVPDGRGGEREIEVIKETLHLTVRVKSIEEISNQYNLNQAQREQLNELMNEKYASNWSSLIYGGGNSDIVKVAISQIGNIGRRALLELVWF